jgi:hypothetical protein
MDTFKQINLQGDAIPARAYHGSVVFKGALYVMMGFNGTSRLGDICKTRNGQNWYRSSTIQDTNGNTIAARDSFGLVEHNNKVYLLGGWNGTTYYNHVYVTSDMVQWKRLQNAPWNARYGFVALSLGDRLIIMGGKNSSANINCVWWTRDGVNWTQEPDAQWAIRRYAAGIVKGKKVFVIGGLGATRYNDVWYSQDLRNWTRMDSDATFSARELHAVAQFGPRIVLVGGQTGAASYSAGLFHSTSGNNWYEGDPGIPMGNLRGHSLDFFDGRLFVVGGINGAATYRNQVWEANNQLFGAK